jgi:hypothetical protein
MLNLSQKRFGHLVAMRPTRKRKDGKVVWLCVCDCRKLTQTRSSLLTRGTTKSCGCLRMKHGHATQGCSPEYRAFLNAKYRCQNTNDKSYPHYGGRGIRFLFTSFLQFYAELGPRPKDKTLDRVNNNGHYKPGNVRWATSRQQNNNQRRGNQHMSKG